MADKWEPNCHVDTGGPYASYAPHESVLKISLTSGYRLKSPTEHRDKLDGEIHVCGKCGLLFWRLK